jgi:hypothetical protein
LQGMIRPRINKKKGNLAVADWNKMDEKFNAKLVLRLNYYPSHSRFPTYLRNNHRDLVSLANIIPNYRLEEPWGK